MNVLVLLTDTSKYSLEALSAATAVGKVTLGFVECGAVKCAGVERVLAVSGEAFEQPRYATDAAAAEALVKASDAEIVIAPNSSRWARALPGVAQRVGGRVDSHIVGLAVEGGALTASRWYYRQRIEGTISRKERPWFLLVESGIAEAATVEPAAAEEVAVEVPATRTEVVGVEALASDRQTIRPDAGVLFVAGAGWTKKQKDGQVHIDDAGKLILGFVQGARASLGSSKSLVDLSGEGQAVLPFLTHLHQVGQTGATPRHPKGLATCCHGEEPHVVGWRFIGERRAINLDANCGWARGKADVLYVADAFAVMARVNELLQK
jgi:electron transfer flavoprotein alpha subunit